MTEVLVLRNVLEAHGPPGVTSLLSQLSSYFLAHNRTWLKARLLSCKLGPELTRVQAR